MGILLASEQCPVRMACKSIKLRMSTLFPLANADDSAYADAFGADPWSVTSILSPSVEATSPSLRNYNLEHLTPQMVPAALKTAEPSVIPTAKSTQVLAARATAGVVTRPLTAELVANLAAPLPLLPLLLLLRILRLLVPTVVAAPLLLVLLATPTVPMEVAVLRTDTAERRPITVVQDARADAQILLVEEEEEEVHPTLPVRHLPHLRSPFSESQPLVLQLVQPPLTAHVALTITTPSAGIGPKEVAALRMVYVQLIDLFQPSLT